MGNLEFSTDDLVITADGKVEIDNPALAKDLIEHVKKLGPETAGIFDNCNCSSSELLSRVALKGVVPMERLRLDPGRVGIFDNCNC
ncbi:MAG: hypothetical protein ABW153_13770 [Sedimenticola sp.]